MNTGTQFRGMVLAGQVQRWYTYNWPAEWHLLWTVVPVTPLSGAPQVEWEVAVERASATYMTYWLTVRNLTDQDVEIEARYAVLS